MNILRSLIKYLTKDKKAQSNIVIIPIIPPEEFFEEEPGEGEELLCQSCLEDIAVKSCPNCGVPLCLDCYVIHVIPAIRKKKKQEWVN